MSNTTFHRHEQVPAHLYRPENEYDLAALTRFEKVYTKVMATADDGARDAAEDIAHAIRRNVADKGRCVIGLGAGKCVLKVYDELVKLYFADKVNFADVVFFNIGELGLGEPNDTGSTMSRLRNHLFNKIEVSEGAVHTFSSEANQENVHKLCKAYESEIAEQGGLDLVICELTRTASLAFNEPGATASSKCRLVLLSGETRHRVSESFQRETPPATAVTLGIGNLLAARHVICVAWGVDSAVPLYDAIEGRMDEHAPASYLQMHDSVKIIADLEAASRLTRIRYPWRVTNCRWTDKLIRRAIVWLSDLTGKPILKLTDVDYNDHGLGDLVAQYESAYNVNIKIFNDLQHTITGWPGGKPDADDSNRPETALPYPKRVLAFSPHPDDVVVSMGGTLQRLVQQGHDVHVAFQTSGDVAIADEDLERTLMLVDKMAQHFAITDVSNVLANLSSHIRHDKDVPDDPNIRFVKGAIFTCEGYMSCQSLGVKRENIHELSMPFYQQSPDGMGRVGEGDVATVEQLIRQIKPHRIFVADDLNDPYGTHERASRAVMLALENLKDEPFMQGCRVWLYRGQWGQWNVDRVEMAVPMSPEEFALKLDAIIKHQSQVHDAPLRNTPEGKLSWQRTIERNRNLADHYNRLGLAAYEAIEAFVRYL